MTASNHPTGAQYALRSADGRVTAEIAQVGASLRAFTVGGVDLVPRYPLDAATPAGSGTVLVPWPNRVRDGRWTQRGRQRQLAITDRRRATPRTACCGSRRTRLRHRMKHPSR